MENKVKYPTNFDKKKTFKDLFIPLNTIYYYLTGNNIIDENDRNKIIKEIKKFNSEPKYGNNIKPLFFDIEATNLPSDDVIITEIGLEYINLENNIEYFRCFLDISSVINRYFSSYLNCFHPSLCKSNLENIKNIKLFNSLKDMENFICDELLKNKKICIIGNNISSDIQFLIKCKMFKLLSLLNLENSVDQTLFNKFLKINYNVTYNKYIDVSNKLHTTIECYNIFKERNKILKYFINDIKKNVISQNII